MAVKIMTNTKVATRCGDYLGQRSDARTRQLVSHVSRSEECSFVSLLIVHCPDLVIIPHHTSSQQTLGLILSELYSQLDHYAVVLKYVNRSDCSSNTRCVENREKTLRTLQTLH